MPMGEMRDEDKLSKPKKCKHRDHGYPGQTCPGCGTYFRGDPMG